MSTTREIISLHFGQAGVQTGDAIWQTITAEHDISSSGELPTNFISNWKETNSLKTFFHNGPDTKYIPRTLFVDTEPSVVDEIRTGYYRNLFHPDLLITSIEDAANNFSRGFYTIGYKMLHPLIEKCRYIAESCDNFQGFIGYSGTGGGTGSGLFSLFLERAMVEYSGKSSLGNLIVPGKTLSNCVVDPYNTILRLGKASSSDDLNFIVDNESLYSISKQVNICRPTYHSINKILTPVFSTITAPIRFDGSLTGTISEISTNLIPYPRINFPVMSYTPYDSTEVSERQSYTCNDLTFSLFGETNNLLSQSLSKGIFMSSILIYRGYFVVNDIVTSICNLKKQNKFRWVDWCPTGFKITHTNIPAIHTFASNVFQPTGSILMLANHSSIINKLKQETKKFNLLYRKKSYIHWYFGEGMEEIEFEMAIEDVRRVKTDYKEVLREDLESTDSKYDSKNERKSEKTITNKFGIKSKENSLKKVEKNPDKKPKRRPPSTYVKHPENMSNILTVNKRDSTEYDYTHSTIYAKKNNFSLL